MIDETVINRTQIINMANDLGKALAQSKEIKEYREAEQKLAMDEEACRLTRIFKEAQVRLAGLQANPESKQQEIDEATAHLEQADRNMKENTLIAEYYRAGSAFNNLIYQINQLLKFYSMEPDEEVQFQQETGCNTCRGCAGQIL
jgi:cell fate (sporulation/competence/biofilm development) regulator YlbF (YheA/YmcA/DUF963 family)